MVPNFLTMDGKSLFLFGARWSFGFWLLYVGASKWLGGPSNFVGYLSKEFSTAWPPELLVFGLGWIILVLEPLLGLLLLVGKHQRLIWLAVAKLMFILVFGKTLLGDYATVSNNWQYFFLALAMAALSSPSAEVKRS